MKKPENKKQIRKFGLYGFLKNLKFYEPYLWIYFLASGLTFLEIGLLYSVKEVIIYVFEVPSGVLADRYGKKTELVICFIFYIFSFVIFFFGRDFYIYLLAMVFFGLGEAFRSGTHKAMIMSYLDKNEITESKSQVYGKTRSYSLIGSMVASFASIILVFVFPSLSWLFIVAIIPYILDLLLILSYPNYLNEKRDVTFSFKEFLKENINSIKYVFQDRKVLKLLVGSSSYNAGFKSLKDYIQPLILTITASYIIFGNIDVEDHSIIYVGVIYSFIYLLSALASLNAHKVSKLISQDKAITIMWVLSGVSFIILSVFINNIAVLIIVFLAIYIFLNIRKPLMIEKIGNTTIDDKRASVLSIESQFTSLLIALFAPVLGYISDVNSISVMFVIVGIVMISIYVLKIIFDNKESTLRDN